jgi:hypothetical protein
MFGQFDLYLVNVPMKIIIYPYIVSLALHGTIVVSLTVAVFDGLYYLYIL